MDFEYVCVDVETNGLNSNKDEILEIVAIELNLIFPVKLEKY